MSFRRYAAVLDAAETPREAEARAFRHVNGLLAAAADAPSRVAALHKTHQLWGILLTDLASSANGLPSELKARLASLGLWVLAVNAGAIAFYRDLGAVPGRTQSFAIGSVSLVETAMLWPDLPALAVAA